jgi:hypothetical protein
LWSSIEPKRKDGPAPYTLSVSISIPKLAAGPYFYKYSSTEHLDWLKDTILNHSVYFPTLGQLNDPADAKPRLKPVSPDDLASYIYAGVLGTKPGLSAAGRRRESLTIQCMVHSNFYRCLRRYAEKLYGNLNQDHRAFCLSKHYDNLVMWAKYAGNHSGYCLEFHRQYAPFNIACDVTYTDNLPLMDMTDPQDRGPFAFIKHSRWSGEEEVRIGCLKLPDPNVHFDPDCLRRIILGPHMKPEHEETIRAWAKQREPILTVVKAYFDALDLKMKLPLSGIGMNASVFFGKHPL